MEAAPGRVQNGVMGPEQEGRLGGAQKYVGGVVGLGASKGKGKAGASGRATSIPFLVLFPLP